MVGTEGEARQRLHTRDRLLVVIVPLLLVVVASLAILRFHQDRQSSWQGAGFGMFATYDNGVSRFTRIEVDGRTRDARGLFGDLVDRSEVRPLGPAPRELAQRIKDRTGAQRVVVEIWGVDVDPGDGTIEVSTVPIRTVVVE